MMQNMLYRPQLVWINVWMTYFNVLTSPISVNFKSYVHVNAPNKLNKLLSGTHTYLAYIGSCVKCFGIYE
jgi:hypothetical protein